MTGRDDTHRAGYPSGDPHEMPADLAAVQADDALLDILGSGGEPSDANDELTRVLAAWRREVHAEPVGELVDTNTALAVIWSAARRPVPHRSPVYSSIAAVAALLVIAFAGVGLASKQAQPGDQLWGVTKVLYSNYARSVETANVVRDELNQARTALQENQPKKAEESLQRVRQQLPVIGDTEGRTDLTARHRELEQILRVSSGDSPGKAPAWPVFPPSPSPTQRLGPTTPPASSSPTSAGRTAVGPTSKPGPSPVSTPQTSGTVSPSPGAKQAGPDDGGKPGVHLPPGPSPEDPPTPDYPGGDPGSVPESNPRGATTSFPGGTRPYPGVQPPCDRAGRHCGS